MVGLGTIRDVVVGGDNRPATADEMARMERFVRAALADGACGASSGLEYTPGAFAPRDELIALCKPLAGTGLPYATHMRNEDDQLLEAIDEAIAVARGASCPLQISHLKTQGPRNWGKLDDAFARVAAARAAGCDAAFDRYPYIAYQTGLTNLFPVWSRDGSTEAFLARLGRSGDSRPNRSGNAGQGRADRRVGQRDDRQRRRTPPIAPPKGSASARTRRAEHADPYATAVALLQRNRANVGMVGFAMSEDNLERILAHPHGMVCSDGGAFASTARRVAGIRIRAGSARSRASSAATCASGRR